MLYLKVTIKSMLYLTICHLQRCSTTSAPIKVSTRLTNLYVYPVTFTINIYQVTMGKLYRCSYCDATPYSHNRAYVGPLYIIHQKSLCISFPSYMYFKYILDNYICKQLRCSSMFIQISLSCFTIAVTRNRCFNYHHTLKKLACFVPHT